MTPHTFHDVDVPASGHELLRGRDIVARLTVPALETADVHEH
ncbi:hypothetical protein [Streptomyces mutomycini]|uniref:Cupin n=1 Tax=Streptomyces mutomycini TaxID=284036 RepID=A0ABW0BA63_9ACTN|nr:hypothetical protein [Streptomyces mutomycini]